LNDSNHLQDIKDASSLYRMTPEPKPLKSHPINTNNISIFGPSL